MIFIGKASKFIVVYGGGIGILSGVIFSTWQFGWKEYTKNETQKREDLSSYANYGKYLTIYNTKIQENMAKFLSSKNIVSDKPSAEDGIFAISKSQDINELDGSYVAQSREKKFNDTCKIFLHRVAPITQSGFEALKSEDLKEYKTIHTFFDSLAFSIDRDLINFETVFELFTYPAYWKDGERWAEFDPFFELERCLKENWFGEKKSLDGYSSNFLKLGNNYHYTRLVNKYKLLKHETKQLEKCRQQSESSKECTKNISTFAEIDSRIKNNKKIIKDIKQEKQRMEDYSENKNLPPWYQLYEDRCSKRWFFYMPPNLYCIWKYEE